MHTPTQLRLAAGIIETKHPFEYQPDQTIPGMWVKGELTNPKLCICQNWPIRLVLATPPYPAILHNPDNLTAEQVGVGYRLLTEVEFSSGAHATTTRFWSINKKWKKRPTNVNHYLGCNGQTYRLPISVPWPEQPKPFTLPKEIPWIEWHGGPCPLKDEEVEEWEYKMRCGTLVPSHHTSHPTRCTWRHDEDGCDIIAYRVLIWREPKPKQPLGPEDVTPFSLIRRKPEQNNGQQWHWRCVSYVHGVGIQCGDRGYKWEELQKDYQINRPRHRDADGNPTKWEPCEK